MIRHTHITELGSTYAPLIRFCLRMCDKPTFGNCSLETIVSVVMRISLVRIADLDSQVRENFVKIKHSNGEGFTLIVQVYACFGPTQCLKTRFFFISSNATKFKLFAAEIQQHPFWVVLIHVALIAYNKTEIN